MIRRIHLRNFESHEDSTIEFTEGLNLLIGQSNQGKSSIIRGLALVVANQFDKEQVRTGSDFCEVTVETDRGYVTAQRGESTNRWEVCRLGEDSKVYRSIGTGVPPETIDILGIGEVAHGDITELPNIMFQHEKHYMLSEINGKKATSNMIARMMDDAIGIGGMEELIKSMADDLVSYKKELNSLSSDISETKSQMIDDVLFNDYERIMSKMESLEKEINDDASLIAASAPLRRRIDEITSSLESAERAISLSLNILSKWDEFKSEKEKHDSIQKTKEVMRKISHLTENIDEVTRILSMYQELSSSLRKEQMLARLMKVRSELDSTVGEDIDSLLAKYRELKASVEKAETARESLNRARRLYLDIQKASREIESIENTLEEAEHRNVELRRILGVCPLCGAELK